MFSKELEEVIDAAIADGVLTDKERAVLHKRAQAEGVDPDELDVVIDGRLAKKKKEEDWLRPAPPKAVESTKVGNVMKCPNCGAPYQPGTGKCPECGHYFQNVAAVSSAKNFADGLQEIMNKWTPIREQASKEEEYSREGKRTTHKVFDSERAQREEIENYITNFPIPSSKTDLLEFITNMSARRHTSNIHLEDAYRAKLNEAINKAKIYCADDPQLKPLIERYSKFSWENLSSMGKFCMINLALMIFAGIIALVMRLAGVE